MTRNSQTPLSAPLETSGPAQMNHSHAAALAFHWRGHDCSLAQYVAALRARLVLLNEYFAIRRVRERHMKRRLRAHYGLAPLHGARQVRAQHATRRRFQRLVALRVCTAADGFKKPGGGVNIARLPMQSISFCPLRFFLKGSIVCALSARPGFFPSNQSPEIPTVYKFPVFAAFGNFRRFLKPFEQN